MKKCFIKKLIQILKVVYKELCIDLLLKKDIYANRVLVNVKLA